MDFRTASKRVPAALFPTGECRVYLGQPATAFERRGMEQVRDTLKKLARRGDWDVLHRLASRDLTPDEVHAAVQRVGLDSYHLELTDPVHATRLQDAVDEWLETLHGPTKKQYVIALRRLVKILGPDTPMDRSTIGRGEIRHALAVVKREGLAHNTRAGHMIAWSSFFSWWTEREEDREEAGGPAPTLGRNPVRALKAKHKVRTKATRHVYLTEEQFAELLEATAPEIRAHYATLCFCGLRPDEFYNLKPETVALPHKVLVRAREDWAPKGYERWGVGEGDIPIHRTRLLPLLQEHEKRWAGADWFFVNPRTGGRWNEAAFRGQLKRDCKRVGLAYGRDKPDGVTPHTFRHTIASWLAQKDVQLMKIAELLRDRVDTVAKHYAHLLPRDLDETLNRVL